MSDFKNVIFLTGGIGAGKSTIADNVLKRLAAEKIINAGDIFGYTTVRVSDPAGGLEGFEIITYGGERCPLASVKRKTANKYRGLFVNKNAFDQTLTLEFERAKRQANPVIHIDEIGLMEKIAPRYINMLTDLIKNFKVPIIAIVKFIEKDDFLDQLKGFDNVELYTVTKINRNRIEAEVYEEFTAIIKNRSDKNKLN
jgi:nucleoside-triphosphatase THEP1